MADPELVNRLNVGVSTWNQWRSGYEAAKGSLKRADLTEANLTGAYLANAMLSLADLSGANLSGADLTGADLSGTVLIGANLAGADLINSKLHSANLKIANLAETNLTDAKLNGANLSGILQRGPYLTGMTLRRADLRDADLTNADLSKADLTSANLRRANLTQTRFTGARFSETVFADTSLKFAEGLDAGVHGGPSVLDYQTLARSGRLPLGFLRGCGLPDNLIDYMPALLNQPIQFYSCFISYSTRDGDFASRLHADLQSRGVRCWFSPHDVKGGRKLHEQIDEAIRIYDRLLLILSEHSINSEWVVTEISKARKTREARA